MRIKCSTAFRTAFIQIAKFRAVVHIQPASVTHTDAPSILEPFEHLSHSGSTAPAITSELFTILHLCRFQ